MLSCGSHQGFAYCKFLSRMICYLPVLLSTKVFFWCNSSDPFCTYTEHVESILVGNVGYRLYDAHSDTEFLDWLHVLGYLVQELDLLD